MILFAKDTLSFNIFRSSSPPSRMKQYTAALKDTDGSVAVLSIRLHSEKPCNSHRYLTKWLQSQIKLLQLYQNSSFTPRCLHVVMRYTPGMCQMCSILSAFGNVHWICLFQQPLRNGPRHCHLISLSHQVRGRRHSRLSSAGYPFTTIR
jgi:hypothetical protein